ncbi:unnamed protein product [Effrenium voratum]|nr:unnamed protein product [Effrenium voratum]
MAYVGMAGAGGLHLARTFEHLCGAWAHVAGTAMPLVLWHQCCADGWQVWDAAADCAETLPSVELHTPLNARESVLAVALMPPATLAVASGDDYASLEKNSRIEFYPAHEIGQHMPTAALYFSGEILTMLAYGDRLIVALAGLASGSDIVFVSCNSGVAKKEFGAAKVGRRVHKFLAYEDHILVALHSKSILIYRWLDLLAGRSPRGNLSLGGRMVGDMTIFSKTKLVVSISPGYLYVFSLPEALEGSKQPDFVMSPSQGSHITRLCEIPELGLVIGSFDQKVRIFREKDLATGSCFKTLEICDFPQEMVVTAEGFLVVASSNLLEVFGWKAMLPGTRQRLPFLSLPVPSMIIGLLQLPGLGLAVISRLHVHIYSHGVMTKVSRPWARLEVEGAYLRMMKPVTGNLLVTSSPGKPPSVFSYGGDVLGAFRWQGDLKVDVGDHVDCIQELEDGVIAVGLQKGVGLFNLSAIEAELPRFKFLDTDKGLSRPFYSMCYHGQKLLAGSNDKVFVFSDVFSDDTRTATALLLGAPQILSVACLGNDHWAAGGNDEKIQILAGPPLEVVARFSVHGPVRAIRLVQQHLLCVTDSMLTVFEKTESGLLELASLATNHIETAGGSLDFLSGGLLVGLMLYRDEAATSTCAAGFFSKQDRFFCDECPTGWHSVAGAGSCEYPEPQLKLKVLGILLLELAVASLLAKQSGKFFLDKDVGWSLAPENLPLAHLMPYLSVVVGPAALWAAWASQHRAFLALAPGLTLATLVCPREEPRSCSSLKCLVISSLIAGLAAFLFPPTELDQAVPVAGLVVISCNNYLALQLGKWLCNPYVNSMSGPSANTAGVRVTNGLVSFMYLMTSSVVILTYAAGSGHPVQTPTGLADADRAGPWALGLLAGASLVSMVAVVLADKACFVCEEKHRTVWSAKNEQVQPTRLPKRCCGRRYLLKASAVHKTWRFRHWLSMFSALYDSYTFHKQLKRSFESQTSEWKNFGAILLVALVTAVVGFLALLMDFWSLRRPELGDRNFRLSTLFKCILLYMKLHVLKVPSKISMHLDASMLEPHVNYGLKGRIPIWVCASRTLCPVYCTVKLKGKCTYAGQPAYSGCFCEYLSVGIPGAVNRLMVFANCLVSILVISMLANSRMRTRGIFSDRGVFSAEMSLRALGCVSVLPTGLEHLPGVQLEAVDGASLSEGVIAGPATLLVKERPRYGSIWVSSGFKAYVPLAHISTAAAIWLVWPRLLQPIILADVVILLLLSLASAVLYITLQDASTTTRIPNSHVELQLA